ncbi:MAG: glutaredoxin [Proteobacteria bacterium]|nr:glutaredoxin [Pseudomonadota bacterium]
MEGGIMSRETNQHFAPHAQKYLDQFHTNIVQEVRDAVLKNDVVIVGMAGNGAVRKARQALQEEGIEFKYLEYGGYFSKWKERLAIKLWSGWPTYPQVFVKGHLMGGNQRTRMAIADGSLQKLLNEKE